ncbi:phage tail tube protein [Tomitella fengzijianii]|uniref:Major tail protein n=1 Tax=Tomitella fengzijianii TaxID=2597660 RepID=A0A516X5M5_9ACTN|nr:hypothetical protein [Tomitella fengzijianii]QDQ97981.1 hypothetical protein FO059_12470 [Tomitella fengzijianii]
MAKNTDNASIYDLGEVWIADSLDTPDPEPGVPFYNEETGKALEGWTEVGLMDGDDGMTTSRDQDKNKHYAWGDILVRQSRQKFTLSRKFSALEDNPTTRSLIWPGSTARTIVTPKPKPIKMAFVKHDGDVTVREITKKHAEVDLDGDVNENESDLTKYELVADIYPLIKGKTGEYFKVEKFDADGNDLLSDEDGDASGEA